MSTSPIDSGGLNESEQTRFETPPDIDSEPAEQLGGLLDAVVRQTSQSSDVQASVPGSSGVTAEVLNVARQYRDLPLTCDPVLFALVRISLNDFSNSTSTSDTQLESIVKDVATTLFEDEHYRERLEAFWLKLVNAVAES